MTARGAGKRFSIDVTRDNFLGALEGDRIAVFNFCTASSPECRGFNRIFETCAANHRDVLFGVVDTGRESSLVDEFKVNSVPTVMLFRQRILLFSQPGALSFAQLEDLLDKAGGFDMDEVRGEIRKQCE